MRGLQKLYRNGGSTVVSIPRPILFALDWLPGQLVIIEVLEDKSLHLRLPRTDDLGPRMPPRLVFDDVAKGTR